MTHAISEPAYVYRAIVRSIYDGDTMRLDMDLGLRTWIRNEPVRLAGIDAPEIRGEERPQGLAARDWLVERIPPGTAILVQTYKDARGKYGRWLVDIWYEDVLVNQEMVELGLAQAY